MSNKRFQNISKFRNSLGKPLWYSDLPINTSSSSEASNLIAVSSKWLAIKWNFGAGGTLGILPINQVGKFNAAGPAPLLDAHTSSLSDWDFSEFDSDLLATGAEDGVVKIWKIPEQGLEATDEAQKPILTITGHGRRVESLRFHPTADKILTTSFAKEIRIWDINAQTDLSNPSLVLANHGDIVQSFAWKGDGSLLGSTSKDLIVRVWDPRVNPGEAVTSGKSHQGPKASRVTWLGNRDQMLTTGYDKMRYRQYSLWDVRDLSKPIVMNTMDAGTGLIIPLFDEDTNKLFLIGKGDGTIGSIEISEDLKPSIEASRPCSTTVPQYGAALLPKRLLDVMQAEIARLMVVTANAIVPVSFDIPRKQYLDFHAELFPDTKGDVPALTAAEWLTGETKLVAKVSLDPKNKKPQQLPASSTTSVISPPATTQTPTQAPTPAATSSLAPQAPVAAIPTVQGTVNTAVTSPTIPLSPITVTSPTAASRFAPTRTSYYRYIEGKPYHPSQHYDDLRGLSTNKSSEFDLIQVGLRIYFFFFWRKSGIAICSFTSLITTPSRLLSISFVLPTKGEPSLHCGHSLGSRWPDRHLPSEQAWQITRENIGRYVQCRASDDAKIRVWKIPEEGLVDDVAEPTAVLSAPHMDRISHLVFNPTVKNVLLSASADRGNSTIRIWDIEARKEKIALTGSHDDVIYSAIWSYDGRLIATTSKDKKVRIFDARTKEKITEGPSHDSVRASRLVWLGETGRLASIGFGRGSSREIIVYNTADLSTGAVDKKSIDVSPSSMVPYYDTDCSILYLAGSGDRSIHTYEVTIHPSNSGNKVPIINSLPTVELLTLQQGFAFTPKRHCNVRAVEIAKMYRLTPTSVETIGVNVPRSRTEFFQDDIFIPTHDIENPSLDSVAWFAGENKELRRVDLRPVDMTPCMSTGSRVELWSVRFVSQAPPPVIAHKKEVVRETINSNVTSSNDQVRMLPLKHGHTHKERKETKRKAMGRNADIFDHIENKLGV
ncbi:hypothetical protein BC936DRAFT_144358 [Jimgerdemannia flammicorona]|uniref:Coronin n=1 Tax=Jimgerdemannia flammicorona TaxID=994334 RepID=A0A433DM76_9FUNG|nr:hypothetical protein BC936DRAFT_144358 [Jimgerdemannia flammicorona]